MSSLSKFSADHLSHHANRLIASPAHFQRHCNAVFDQEGFAKAYESISAWPKYAPTPLVELAGLASAIGVGHILYKDEGTRFGLGSFKALGGAYAVSRLVEKLCSNQITVASATDGNHGRSVAWGAKNVSAQAVIYIHKEVSKGREAALKELGARVVRIDGNYDDSVRACAEDAAANGWHVVSDTSWPGYQEMPKLVMDGYSVMAHEAIDQSPLPPTHVFLQGGVGGLAAAVIARYVAEYGANAPRFIVVEPAFAHCLFESAKAGQPRTVSVEHETLMAGLSCGEVSELAWPILQHCVADFITMADPLVAPAMQLLAQSPFDDKAVTAGESAVAGIAALLACAQDQNLRDAMDLSQTSRVMLIGTEGATDPEIYAQLINQAY